jgi:hypothetical protein
MNAFEITIKDIPHGHGLSFKRGVADGLLQQSIGSDQHPETHSASYRRGVELGEELKTKIAALVKD